MHLNILQIKTMKAPSGRLIMVYIPHIKTFHGKLMIVHWVLGHPIFIQAHINTMSDERKTP